MQKHSSENTSINSLGRLYKYVAETYEMFTDKVNISILDYGAGKYLIGTKYLQEKGFVVTPYNQGDTLKEEHYNLIILSNVINVIDDEETIEEIINWCKNHSKLLLVTTYEGDKTGIGKESKADCWQRNEKTKAYERFGLDTHKTSKYGKILIG